MLVSIFFSSCGCPRSNVSVFWYTGVRMIVQSGKVKAPQKEHDRHAIYLCRTDVVARL